ncbi:uncharacterized protein LOC132859425 [Tachysurus vachellii]|uniref:uncharacterized protein LOC132859425 n=1 Tax=Tachysurus vachellii TaxID=175792 RepID=UPI00296B2349|nr:uncharacterized protein LOC132859425 [Tachysurus vachellii]
MSFQMCTLPIPSVMQAFDLSADNKLGGTSPLDTNHIVNFADNTTVVGLTNNNNVANYRIVDSVPKSSHTVGKKESKNLLSLPFSLCSGRGKSSSDTSLRPLLKMMLLHQGCVLSPLLYSLYTYDYVANSKSTTIIKFADDTVVVGLISNNDETAYLQETKDLERWCQENNLLLNVSKTFRVDKLTFRQELIVDFSTKQKRSYQPLNINGTPME